MDSLCGISRSLYGQPWTSWCTSKELESEEESPERERSQPAADVMRLPKEDMTLFGFCPEQDDFYIVICELCGLGIKPMGMNHHMNLRHSKGEESAKTAATIKNIIKECDVKPKNKKHVSPANIVADYGLGVGLPQKVFATESTSVSVVKTEHHPESSQLRPPSNSKLLKLEADKINKVSSSSKNHTKQYNSQEVIAKLSSTVNAKLPSVKSSRSSNPVFVDSVKQSKTAHRTVPIKSGLRLQLFGTTNLLLFKRNSRSVLAAAAELKVRHRRRHKRSRSHKSRSKVKNSKKYLPVVVKSSLSSSPVVAPCPSLVPSPYVALTPLTHLKWNNNAEGIPSHLKPSFSSHPSGGTGFHAGSIIPVSKASDGVLQMLTVDTANNHSVKPEMRPPLLSCKSSGLMKNHLDSRMNQSYLQGNSMLVPALMPQASIRVPDISWSSVHPKSLGVCPLQIRKIGGLIASDRRLDCIWQYMKSALLEQEAYQTTVLCSSPSSQPDFHQNHKSSIKTILASLSPNNNARNSVCKPSNLGLRQFPLNAYGEKSYGASLRGVIDVPPSVLLISSNHSKALSKTNSFLSQVTKVSPAIKQNPPCTATQPYPGIFLKNGQHIFPRHFRISLKRRKPMPVVNSLVKKQKESSAGEKLENMVYHDEYNLPKCVPLMQFPASNGLSEPVNNYASYPEEGFKQVVTQSELELDVNSIGLITTNGESLIESTGRLPSLDQIKNELISGFHTLKNTSQIMDTTNKASCRKVTTTTQCPNVRISSATGTVQVSKPQITYLTTGPVTFQQISPQMMNQIQLQPKSKHPSAPLKLISPPQAVSLAASRTMLLQQEKDES